ncbi:MAG: hypothetical protein IPM79_04335 [Polyangiaceae bacterium]|nr:hypothetical protein [Polyangiaceae bacterium]
MVAGKQTTNLASINKTALESCRCCSQRRAEQSNAIRVLSEAERRLSTELSTLSKLGLLKAGLMEDLLTGRVRVTALLENASP